MGELDEREYAKRDRSVRNLLALRGANRQHGRDYLRRLRRATRPPDPAYRRYPPMPKVPPRTYIILGLALLLLALTAVLADDGEGASRRQVKQQICRVFGPHCGPALRVASCES